MSEQQSVSPRATRTNMITRFFSAYRRYTDADPGIYPTLGPSSLDHSSYRDLEATIGFGLPWSFKEWHRSFCVAGGFEVASVTLPLSPARDPLDHLSAELIGTGNGRDLLPHRLIPFGFSEATGEFLAFDARVPQVDNEWPIVAFDHEWPATQVPSRSVQVHANFAELLEALASYLEREVSGHA